MTPATRVRSAVAALCVLGASWALAEGTALAAGAETPSWQTLAVSVLAVLAGWLQYQTKRAQTAASHTLTAIAASVDRLAEQLRMQGERLARLEGEHAARARHYHDMEGGR